MIVAAKRTRRAALALVAGAVLGAHAEDPPPRDFGFRGLEIFRFLPGSGVLRVTDLNGDGRADILFANNRASRVEVLLRKIGAAPEGLPALEECFDNHGFVVDQAVQGLVVVDLDGDGRPDLAMGGTPWGVEYRLQEEDGRFGPPQRMRLRPGPDLVDLKAGDLDGDGKVDLVSARRDEIEILWNDGDLAFPRRQRLPVAGANCRGVDLRDCDGDGHLDLVIYLSDGETPIRIRRGDGKGRFDWEIPVPLPTARAIRVFDWNGRAVVGAILQSGSVLRLYGFESKPQEHFANLPEVVGVRLPLEGAPTRDPLAWQVADLNADGWEDFVFAAPEWSRLLVHCGGPEGLEADPLRIDTLTGVAGVAATPAGDLLVFSPMERAVGVHPAGKLQAFPRVLPDTGKPLCMAVGAAPDTAMVVSRHGGAITVGVARVSTGEWIERFEAPLKNDPHAVLAFPLEGDSWAAVFFLPYQEPVWGRVRDGKLQLESAASFRALAEPLTPQSFAFRRTEAPAEVLVAGARVGRLYAWQDGVFQVGRQFNAGAAEARLAGCAWLPATPDTESLPVFFDNTGATLVLPGASDDLPVRVPVRGGVRDFAGLRVLRGGDGATLRLLVVSRSEAILLRAPSRTLQPVVLAEYTSPSEEPSLRALEPVRVGAREGDLLALVDTANRALELVEEGEANTLRTAVAFEVYHAPMPAGDTSESGLAPHSLAWGDVDGDGLMDLVGLVHDKLVVYPGE